MLEIAEQNILSAYRNALIYLKNVPGRHCGMALKEIAGIFKGRRGGNLSLEAIEHEHQASRWAAVKRLSMQR